MGDENQKVAERRRQVQDPVLHCVDRDLEQEVAAQRLGVDVDKPVKRGEETVSYQASLQLQEQLGDIVNRYLHMRHAYADPGQPRHVALEGIALLADAGVVDADDMILYRAAIKKMEVVLATDHLASQVEYARYEADKTAVIVDGLFVLGAVVLAIGLKSGWPIIGAGFGLVLLNNAVSLFKLDMKGDSAEYKKAVENHLKKYGVDMDTAIRNALNSGACLHTQLQAGPLEIKAAYANRAQEIEQTRTALIEYFENQPGFFERVINAGRKKSEA